MGGGIEGDLHLQQLDIQRLLLLLQCQPLLRVQLSADYHVSTRTPEHSRVRHSQDISSLAVILENHGMIFPERGTVRDGEKCDPEPRRVVHHQPLHVRGHEGSGLVEDRIL